MQVQALALFHMGLFNFFLSLWVHFSIVYSTQVHTHISFLMYQTLSTFALLHSRSVHNLLWPHPSWCMNVSVCVSVSVGVCVCLCTCRTVLCRVMWGACVHCGMSWTVPESELHGPNSSRLSFKAVNTDCAAWSSHALNWRYTQTPSTHLTP